VRGPKRSSIVRALHTGLVAALVVLCAERGHAAETQRFSATARDVNDGHVLYTEQYEVQVEDQRWISGTTRYVLPSGKTIADRKFDFASDRYVPVFALDQTDPNYHEGISRIDHDKIDVYQVRDGARQAASIDRTKDVVADCGAQAFVADHMDDLQAGKPVRFTLIVAGRVDSFRLRATKVKDVEVAGRRGVQIRIELDSVLSLVLPPIEIVIEPSTKRILEYSGIATVKDPATRKSYLARITFAYP
jgi:ribosomal protein S27AE